MTKQYMAIDQYGNTFHGLTYPRKELCERLYCKHASMMRQEPDGKHVGYVIAGHWLRLYKVEPFAK